MFIQHFRKYIFGYILKSHRASCFKFFLLNSERMFWLIYSHVGTDYETLPKRSNLILKSDLIIGTLSLIKISFIKNEVKSSFEVRNYTNPSLMVSADKNQFSILKDSPRTSDCGSIFASILHNVLHFPVTSIDMLLASCKQVLLLNFMPSNIVFSDRFY